MHVRLLTVYIHVLLSYVSFELNHTDQKSTITCCMRQGSSELIWGGDMSLVMVLKYQNTSRRDVRTAIDRHDGKLIQPITALKMIGIYPQAHRCLARSGMPLVTCRMLVSQSTINMPLMKKISSKARHKKG